ncbi:hypothetical protein Taro_031576 [Colocasia esculenta]|uniref:Retrotransposon gag domain-containing protein n=1 Tax=Colocasia esculenta TaxID=4460 RepID=A0A843W3J4_COLES|nr:hypothetical protein [Colocasia esculenta]
MQQEFLKKFYPIGCTNTMRRVITRFSQHSGELMHESWERLKELLRKCPNHDLSRQMVDASCGGAFMTKSEDEAYDLFKTLSENSINHASLHSYERALGPSKKAGLYELRGREESDSRVEDLIARLDQRLEQKLEQNFDQLLSFTGQATPKLSQPPETCSIWKEVGKGQVGGVCAKLVRLAHEGCRSSRYTAGVCADGSWSYCAGTKVLRIWRCASGVCWRFGG